MEDDFKKNKKWKTTSKKEKRKTTSKKNLKNEDDNLIKGQTFFWDWFRSLRFSYILTL
jgi:hypothetical protein